MSDAKEPRKPRRWLRRTLAAVGALIVAVGVAGYVVYGGGESLGPGTIHPQRLPAALVHARDDAQRAAERGLGAGPAGHHGGDPQTPGKQILFGDLHVHTTFSGDAFLRSLPMLQGEGAHPPADACDFARFCSQLDFFALTDHAESLTPARWAEERETVRRCNAVAGDPRDPDLVVFAGWEWTQVGLVPEDHYGHKNVLFRDVEDDKLPARVIAATGPISSAIARSPLDRRTILYPAQDFANRKAYLDLMEFQKEIREVPLCPEGVDERALPPNCRDEVATPRELFAKLTQWGFDTLVIPHGTTWGFYTPVGSDWKKQLTGPQRDPSRQFLMEVYSGHGNSEEYRAWRGVEKDAQGNEVCPPPTKDYEPCCWRAGEIIRARCGDAPAEECERRVREARANHLAARVAAHLTVPGASVEDWGDCGQCRDCFLPAYNYRPGGSAQLVLATTDFDDPAHPRNQPWGFLASSDNHSARPGTGYKEYGRKTMTETAGARDETWHGRLVPPSVETPESKKVDPRNPMVQPFLAVDVERQASFFLTGGLVAVHSEGRNREAIWDALKRREVYGTSGERILLWFDLVNGPAPHPMGSEVSLREPPRFTVRAAGAFEQIPGCAPVEGGLPAERLERLCRGECNRPSERRKRITRIEIIRIRPQRTPDEPIASLVADPWRTLPCPATDGTCSVTFEDPEFVDSARDATYYARAIEAPSLAVNGGGLRCERDAQGACIKAHPCYGDYRTSPSDDCLGKVEERAWSSPIFVRQGGR